MKRYRLSVSALVLVFGFVIVGYGLYAASAQDAKDKDTERLTEFDRIIRDNARNLFEDGRQTFRFDTFGDESFWGDTLQLHQAIKGANLGGVGPGLSPNAALGLGLKVDVDLLPEAVTSQLKAG